MKNDARPITVLQLCEHFGNDQISFHGVARSFELWLPAFDRDRFRVLLCSRQKGVATAEERFRAVGVHPLYLGYGKRDPRNLLRLMRIVREEKVDIIHAHGYGACTWGRIAGILLRKPVIVHERCNYGTVPWSQRPVEWVLGRFTAAAFAVSESTRRFTVAKRHIPDGLVKVLYSGIPLGGVRKAEPAWIAACRADQGAGPGERVLGVVGRLESHKGHLDAFRALEIVRKDMPAVRLWIVGDGRYEAVLRQWVADHGLQDAIRFLGYRSDVLQVIQCFDVQVFPSHQEGTPNTLYEAMAVGNASVASTADGQGEILEDGKTALLFTPGDHEAMAAQILRVLKDDALRDALRRAAQVRVRDFDMTTTIATLEATYERLVSRQGGEARA